MEDVGHGEDADPDDAVGQRHRRRPSHSQLDQSKALEEIKKKKINITSRDKRQHLLGV